MDLIVFAHALAAREDLPIPAWLFAWGASIVLIVSFFALSAGWRSPRFEGDSWRPLGRRLGGALVNPVTEALAGLAGVFLLGLAIYSGFEGTEAPDRNFTLTFIFVTAWLGFPLFGVLLGDLFRAFNPWRAVGRLAGAGFRAISGQDPAHLAYPERLGRWPAAIGLAAFVWLELVWGVSGGVSVGLAPQTAATAAVVYSGYTLAMMALFGVEKWCDRGEAFSVYFGMFSTLGWLEVRDGRLGRRRPFEAAARWAAVPGSLAMVAASIATTSFDGAGEGMLRTPITDTFEWLADSGMSLTTAFRVTDSIFMVLIGAGVAAVYLVGVWGMRTVRDAPAFAELSRKFAHTLIPIAFAYLWAHYFSLFVFQEQAQFTYLLSDPLGDGANIFGTADCGEILCGVDYGVIGTEAIWYVQVAALVIGHVVALTLAHDRGIAIWGDSKLATRSQYWMLAVMVGFTCFGLYLLSAANQ